MKLSLSEIIALFCEIYSSKRYWFITKFQQKDNEK